MVDPIGVDSYHVTSRPPSRCDRFSIAVWSVIFAANTIVPLMFGLELTVKHGRVGVGIASLLLWAGGAILCCWRSSIMWQVILGALITALSQLFPILQIIAGCIGLSAAARLGQAETGGDGQLLDQVTSEVGGFIVTVIAGGVLLAGAAIAGLCLSILHRWWISPSPFIERGT